MNLQNKADVLADLLRQLPAFVIAFSGGVDSGLLAAAAVRAGKMPIMLIFIRPPWVPEREYSDAAALADTLGTELRCISVEFPEELRNNPEDRCYLCKKRILSKISITAAAAGAELIIDGSNADDSKSYRPGKKALIEYGVQSPLEQCGFTKKDVRTLARNYNLTTWNKPAYSCLLTRFPHETIISEAMLTMVEEGEEFLITEGFPDVRLRTHGVLARIEIPPQDRERFCSADRMDRVSRYLKELGYHYVSLDLDGYSCLKMEEIYTA